MNYNNPPLEAEEQKKVVQYLEARRIPYNAPINENIFSGIIRTILIKMLGEKKGLFLSNKINSSLENKAKSLGKSKGFPDLQILRPNKYYSGLFIELKRQKKQLKTKLSTSHTKTSKEQLEWIYKLNNEGYYAIVCYGAIEAIEVIENYMDEV